jgi:hypothetical protein
MFGIGETYGNGVVKVEFYFAEDEVDICHRYFGLLGRGITLLGLIG